MKQVSIIKNSVVTNQASFPSQEEAQSWLDSHIAMGTFGSPDIYASQEVVISEEVRGPVQVLVSEATYDQYGDEITPAIYTIDLDGVISPEVRETQTVLVSPATYSVEVVDITEQLAAQAESDAAQAFLDATEWIVLRAMERGEQLSVEFKAERDATRLKVL